MLPSAGNAPCGICRSTSAFTGALVGLVGVGGGVAAGAFSGRSQHAGKVVYDKDSPMGKLEALSKNMEAAGQKMDAAQKSGNPEEAMKAAMAGLGAGLGKSHAENHVVQAHL